MNQWRLGGAARFLRRRAWRILPAYWAALAFSLAVALFIVPATHKGPPTDRSLVVFGLLLQDLVKARTPNGALWSVAVEAELYLLFPVFLLIRRRLGALVLLAVVTVPVLLLGLAAPHATPDEGYTGLTPHLVPVFVAGLVAAGAFTASARFRAVPWLWPALAACAPVLLLIYAKGSYWTGHHYFWVDLAITPGLTMLIVAVATRPAGALTRLLSSRPLESLGKISYSLYLIHLPILTVLAKKVAPHFAERGPHTYAFVVVVGMPLSLLAAWFFATVFEIPFQRHRSWRALLAAAHRTLAAVPGAPAALWRGLRRPGFRPARPDVSPAASPDDRPDSMPERAPARVG